MDGFKNFMSKFGGAIIGAIVAILILCTGLYKLIVGIILICIGMFGGNYIGGIDMIHVLGKNKYEVKEKLKNFIDRM